MCPMKRYIPVAQTRPTHHAFGYCTCKQDTEERFWGQQFGQMEKGINFRSDQPTGVTGLVKVDHLPRRSLIIFWSDRTEMVHSI